MQKSKHLCTFHGYFGALLQLKHVKLPFLRSTGAIKRARLEENEPTITYERFVEELDIGDSFTSSIIECLVKVSIGSC